MTKRQSRREFIPEEHRHEMVTLFGEGRDTNIIAERYGVSIAYVRSLASRAGVKKGGCLHRPKPKPKKRKSEHQFGQHLDAYKAVRRGFVIPRKSEPDYIELLKTGVSCAEAARLIGAATGQGAV